MTLSDAHKQYRQFIESSDVLNRILNAYPQIAAEQGADFYETAQRFNHLLMFLAQFMAFEGFINFCLREKKGFNVEQIADMGGDIKQKVAHLAPLTAGAPRWRDELIPQIQAELQLRNAWMHGCGNDSLLRSAKLKRCRMPQSVLDHDPVANRDWISGAAWSETALLLGQLVSCIARELGIPT
jgi:hypothetical protein